MGGAFDIVLDTNAPATRFTVPAILVLIAGSVLAHTLTRTAEATQWALPMMFTFRCTCRLGHQDENKQQSNDRPYLHAWVFPCLVARPKYARAP